MYLSPQSLTVVRKYLHLLDMRAEDFEQELLLQTLKGDVTKLIRQNGQLERDLDAMDIKIGLLVKNRISVQVKTNITQHRVTRLGWVCFVLLVPLFV